MKFQWSLKNLLSPLYREPQGGYLFPNTTPVIGNTVLWNNDNLNAYITAYQKNAGLYSVVKRIGKTAAIAPFKVYTVKDERKLAKYKAWTGENATDASLMKAMVLKAQVFEENNSHPLNKLIDRPNSGQRGNEFTENCIGFKLLTGNRYIFMDLLKMGASEGKPFELWNLPPNAMEIKGDGSLFGVSGYTLVLNERQSIDKANIIHSKYWNSQVDASGSHRYGQSPLRAAAKNLTRSDSALQRSVSMLQNAGANGVLYSKGQGDAMDLEQAELLKLKVNKEVLGSSNAGKIALANGDMGYINFGLTAVEMSILDMEKYSMQQLCNIYQVPYTLFSNDSSTYNNIKEAKKELITMAVVPELASLRDDWNEIARLYKEPIYVDYDLSVYPELQEDMEKTATMMEKAWWVKPNEKRLAMGFDEDGDEAAMNEYYIPGGLKTISDVSAGDIEGDLKRQGFNDYEQDRA